MNDFLTVEDINTIETKDVLCELHCIDTSFISTDEFTDVFYDFVKVSHSITGNEHTFIFKIDNPMWAHMYWVVNQNEIPTGNSKWLWPEEVIKCVTTTDSIRLYVLLSNFVKKPQIPEDMLPVINEPVKFITKNQIEDNIPFTYWRWTNTGRKDVEGYIYFIAKKGAVPNLGFPLSVFFILKKTDLVFDLNNVDLAVGSVNHVPLNVDAHYLPSGDLVDGDELDAVVMFNGEELPVVFDNIINDYCFDLDLMNKTDIKPINLTLKVYETEYINPMEYDFTLPCHYEHASSFNELTRLLARNVEIIELTEDLIVNNNILLGYDCLIKGNDSELDLNNHSIFIADGVNVKLQNINFINGTPSIIQKDNSKLEITDCSFTDCSIADDYKGSVLSTTYESENIITNITSTSIYNCPHSIWHDGELTLSKLTATYDKIDNVDTDYSMLLTKYDGIVEINNSVFDIELDTTTLCSEQINIKYAQSLFSISETVQINGLSGEKLRQNNSLNIFDNNVSNINATYYYPKIEACVRIKSDIRDKACCHHIIGTDWIFKNNTLLERL